MLDRAALLLCLLALGGCGANSLASAEDSDVQSSLQYDKMACGPLLSQRNALAQRYGLPQEAKPAFSNVPAGFGTVVPDIRSAAERDKQKAAGEIDAMNRSLMRRQCAGAPKKPSA
ncbi:hypothetical protein [Mesorhizobium sp. SP-1A]|uniref:hypothetical protein n=1 Tax=Mesorhizobium sp. SP-1A TaxID=3077840 RepID=UPI0028F7206F|nr:hypothetical protein [Mesorhizobium sp. SP-1A]